MQPDRLLVQVGDIINAEPDDYHRGVSKGDLRRGDGDLHLVVTHVPERVATWNGDWVALRGIEKPPGQPDCDDMPFVIHRRALPGYVPRPLPAVPGLPEWRGE